jgi:hypothetical protein
MQYITLDTAAEMAATLTDTPKTLQELLPNQVIPMDIDAVMMQPQGGNMRWYPANTNPTTSRGFVTYSNNFLEKSGIGDLHQWKFARDGGTNRTVVIAFGKSTPNRS